MKDNSLGMAFLYNAAICIVTYYFNEKRGIATALAVSGTGFGTVLFPHFLTGMPVISFYLKKNYSMNSLKSQLFLFYL